MGERGKRCNFTNKLKWSYEMNNDDIKKEIDNFKPWYKQ